MNSVLKEFQLKAFEHSKTSEPNKINTDQAFEHFAQQIIDVCCDLASDPLSYPYPTFRDKIRAHFYK